MSGRNRYRACMETGAAATFDNFYGTEDEAEVLVDDLNRHRRHLTTGLLASVAARKATRKQGDFNGNQHVEVSANLHTPTLQQSADQMGVSRRTVAAAATVLKSGTPELVKAMEAGTVAVSTAAVIASKPREEQRRIIAKGVA